LLVKPIISSRNDCRNVVCDEYIPEVKNIQHSFSVMHRCCLALHRARWLSAQSTLQFAGMLMCASRGHHGGCLLGGVTVSTSRGHHCVCLSGAPLCMSLGGTTVCASQGHHCVCLSGAPLCVCLSGAFLYVFLGSTTVCASRWRNFGSL